MSTGDNAPRVTPDQPDMVSAAQVEKALSQINPGQFSVMAGPPPAEGLAPYLLGANVPPPPSTTEHVSLTVMLERIDTAVGEVNECLAGLHKVLAPVSVPGPVDPMDQLPVFQGSEMALRAGEILCRLIQLRNRVAEITGEVRL